MHEKFTALVAIFLLLISTLACSLTGAKRTTWHLTLEIDLPAPDRAAVAERTVAVIEGRLNALGVANPKVQVQGATAGRILVNLPEVPDRERLKKVITAQGLLEMAAVVSPASPSPAITYNTKAEALESLGETLPPNRTVLPYAEQNERRGGGANVEQERKPTKWVVLESPPIIDGNGLRNASAVPSGTDDWDIAFSLTPGAADKFGAWTEAHVNDYMAVVLNKEVKSIAFIQTKISDSGQISGRFTKQAAEDLAMILRTGALPAPVKIVEEGSN